MREKIRELILAQIVKYPDTPSRTLARMIYAMNPDAFLNVEVVRGYIRYYRGRKGVEARKNLIKKYGKPF